MWHLDYGLFDMIIVLHSSLSLAFIIQRVLYTSSVQQDSRHKSLVL